MRNFLASVVLGVGVTLLSPVFAEAHALEVTARILPERLEVVQVEAGFDDDTPAADAVVRVRTGEGREIAWGKTDERGLWQFPRPQPGRYIIRVEYIGHDRELVLELPDDSSSADVQTGRQRLGLAAVGVAALLALAAWVHRRQRRKTFSERGHANTALNASSPPEEAFPSPSP